MFSVKWIYENNGLEVQRIFAADGVTVGFRNDPPDTKASLAAPQLMGRDVISGGLLIVGDGYDLADRSLNFGKVYVMNEAGKTVASYDLGPHISGGPICDTLHSEIVDARAKSDAELEAMPYEQAAALRRLACEVGSGDVLDRLNTLGIAVDA